MSKAIRLLKAKIETTEQRIEAEERRAVTLGAEYHQPLLTKLRREAMRLRCELMTLEKWV